ncbi:unnamed protein product [Parascedosporium putredinis]|uniref:Peptidase C14 caspase domain-containing protein n=1 Tax=Parascedosporium putredinis TaxID=1442378 RepID=A0A9P1H9U3_9PEZI|nr:unnamed protein product [Parascedosporium putredinis]CAI8003377.1 unnamed protein product [Parascedosporium putredinis]
MAVAMEATVRLLLKTTATGPSRAITLRLSSNTTSPRPREDTMLLNSRPTANLRSLRAITPPRTHPNRNITKATVIAQAPSLASVLSLWPTLWTAPAALGYAAIWSRRPSNYSYQYSNCTGKRKALLIGINYFRQKGELRGCINDVRNLSAFLMNKNRFRREDMVILTDDQSDPRSVPTRQNILRAMAWLVNGAEPNDSLFFHFSGHGGQTRDLDGDEDDGYDEVIYPVDYKSAGHIVDDQIHDILVKPLRPGVRLTAIFDSCHSGSAMDLPYIYSTKGVLKEPNLAKDAGMGLLSAVSAYAKGDIGGVASSIFKFAKKATTGDDAYNKTLRTKTSPPTADATINSQATGAMSWAFMTALERKPQQSYVELLNSIRDLLETKYSQRPQLSSSHPMDTNLLFII